MEVDRVGVQRIRALLDRHEAFAHLIVRFSAIAEAWLSPIPSLPLRESWPEKVGAVPDEILDAKGYREFLREAIGEAAVDDFHDALRSGGVEP
jgi:hypothetical protein